MDFHPIISSKKIDGYSNNIHNVDICFVFINGIMMDYTKNKLNMLILRVDSILNIRKWLRKKIYPQSLLREPHFFMDP